MRPNRKHTKKAQRITIGRVQAWYHDDDITEIDISDLDKIGWIEITSIGEENIYFIGLTTDNVHVACYCKVRA